MTKLKDSGIPWIGEIPEHWEITPFKRLLSLNNGCDYKHIVTDYGYPVIGSGGTFAYASNYLCDGEALLLGRKGTVDKPLYVNGKFWTVDTMFYAVPYETLSCKYAYYQSLGFPFSLFSTSTSLPSMTSTDINNLPLVVPPMAEQERIAVYLDEKCGEIDDLIEVEQQMISDLESYRQAVITEAVTHGLNPSEKKSDSGVYWIGNVPNKWHIAKMKYFVNITNGSDPKTEGDIPVYGSGANSFKTCGEFKEGPTVLIGRKGATLHIPHYIEGRYWNVDTAFDTRVNNFNLRYFYYLAYSLDYRAYISATTLPSMTQSNYENMLIPVPPLTEQQKIAAYIDKKCAEIDELIKVKQEKIETLKQYRQSLIFEAVTGKISIA